MKSVDIRSKILHKSLHKAKGFHLRDLETIFTYNSIFSQRVQFPVQEIIYVNVAVVLAHDLTEQVLG
jgi:hypothetical protein